MHDRRPDSRAARLFILFLALTLAPSLAAADDAPATELIRAAAKGDLAKVQALLQQGVSADATNDKGQTALMESARTGKLDVVDALINAGADVNARSQDGSTAAHSAVFAGQSGTLARLVTAGADVKAANAKGETPFHFAVKNATADVHPDIIAILARAGVDVRAEKVGGEPALIYAISSLQPKTVLALVKAGAEPDVKDSKGRPAVVLVADHSTLPGHVEMMAALIASGVDVNARDERGRSALLAAVDISAADYKKQPARKAAANIVYMLASRGADSAAVSAARARVASKGYTLFDTLIQKGVREAAEKGRTAAGSTAAAASSASTAGSSGQATPPAIQGSGTPLETARFKTVLPAGWEVAADDLKKMGMMSVQRQGSSGKEAVYFKFEGPNWSGAPMDAVAAFAKSNKGTAPERVVANGVEFYRTQYEAYGTRQTMLIARHGSTKVTLTVLGDDSSPAVRAIVDALVLK